MRRRSTRRSRAAVLVLAGVCVLLVSLPGTASPEHTESPGTGYEWVPTPDNYGETLEPLEGVHYDWWRCTDNSGCDHDLASYSYGETRGMDCEIPGGSSRTGLGHCGSLLGGTADMCAPGDLGDCFGEHAVGGGWTQVLGPHNTTPGQYDSTLCFPATNQASVGAKSPPTAGHYDCWPVDGTFIRHPFCDGVPMSEQGVEHCGYWRPPPTVSITGVTVTEGDRAVLSVTLTGGDTSERTVQFATADGSAVAGSDYESQSGVHRFSGPGTRTVTIRTIDDSDVESNETFTVALSNVSGVDIGTALATVTIIDNDGATPQQCPTGETGTPPNCVPVVVSTGCNAAGTRLSSLSVTAGSYSLSGFASTTYSYALAVIGERTLQVAATAADSAASVSIFGGRASLGSASQSVYLPSYNMSFSVEVANSGQSCTYTVDVSYQAAPLTECPAMSGQVLVGGVCVDLCSSGFLTQFNADGQAVGCVPTGDCPFDLYGLDSPPVQPYRDYDALWLDDPDTFAPVAPGETASVTRTAVKCAQVWRLDPYTWPNWWNTHQCILDELNLRSTGDCLQFTLSVEAVILAVEADSSYRAWSFRSGGCGNESAPRAESTADPWTAGDAVCDSSAGSWTRSLCLGCSMTAPTNDPGDWSVTLLDGELRAPSATSPYVDIPLEVSITDWGEASHLVVTVTATKRNLNRWYNSWSDWGYTPSWGTSTSTTITVPRRSGPVPADDVIEVNIAEVAGLPHGSRTVCSGWPTIVCRPTTHNQQFVEILRSTLLANDACPVGTDCTDPLQWPVQLADPRGTRCTTVAFGSGAMLPTDQGLGGCDNLNGASRFVSGIALTAHSVLYWPRLWATGTDTFTYSTYGGEATVTVRFTDQPPAAPDITVFDPGSSHTVATFGSPTERNVSYCSSWAGFYCQRYKYRYYVDHHWADTDWSATHHAGVVSLAAVRDGDPDADTATVEIADGNDPHLTGGSGIIGDAGEYSHWATDATEEWVYTTNCYLTCPTDEAKFANFIRGGYTGANQPVNTADGTQYALTPSGCTQHNTAMLTTDITVYGFGSAQNSRRYYANEFSRWSAPTDTDPGCEPSIRSECGDAAMLADWSMCYALWPNTTNPAPLVVGYRACDARREAAGSDNRAFAEYLAPFVASVNEHLVRHRVAGNSNRPGGWRYTHTQAEWDAAIAAVDPHLHDRYCSDGTVIVVLGDLPAPPRVHDSALRARARTRTRGAPPRVHDSAVAPAGWSACVWGAATRARQRRRSCRVVGVCLGRRHACTTAPSLLPGGRRVSGAPPRVHDSAVAPAGWSACVWGAATRARQRREARRPGRQPRQSHPSRCFQLKPNAPVRLCRWRIGVDGAGTDGEALFPVVTGGPGRIRTSVGEADGFTARSLWPLGHRPRPASTIPSQPEIGVPRPPSPSDWLTMPTFDVVSRLDMQEVRNAVDQAAREVNTRYDFRNTGTSVVLGDGSITLNSSTEDRLAAARQVLEEKLVRRKVSLKALDYGKVQEAAGATVRQVAGLRAGISSDRSRELNKFIKGLGIKGVQSSTQGDQLRVQSKKRDDLQAVIAALKEADFDLPLQHVNFRD